ncbi:MAG: hypothetical protein OXF20_16175 [Gammaproteobacteria bacterium]|nr:hypothetical protein [Gammaproteobacteria bacterium]
MKFFVCFDRQPGPVINGESLLQIENPGKLDGVRASTIINPIRKHLDYM